MVDSYELDSILAHAFYSASKCFLINKMLDSILAHRILFCFYMLLDKQDGNILMQSEVHKESYISKVITYTYLRITSTGYTISNVVRRM